MKENSRAINLDVFRQVRNCYDPLLKNQFSPLQSHQILIDQIQAEKKSSRIANQKLKQLGVQDQQEI